MATECWMSGDWEIGGFKVANTYGNVSMGQPGICWAYKSLPKIHQRSIWNNAVYIAYAKQNWNRLTMKVTLKIQR
jgi:hypothetical protein